MRPFSFLAVYVLFWWMTLFVVLPFRLRDGGDDEAHVAGQAESAPQRFSVRRTLGWTSLVSFLLFALFVANYEEGWIGPGAFDLFSAHAPALS